MNVSRCWMKETSKAWLAHYFTTMTLLVLLVASGFVMLFLVYRQIRSRQEWRLSRVAFFSMWGLSCLFGSTWVLAFLSFGPLSQFFVFLFCILNSFQGWSLLNAAQPQSSSLIRGGALGEGSQASLCHTRASCHVGPGPKLRLHHSSKTLVFGWSFYRRCS